MPQRAVRSLLALVFNAVVYLAGFTILMARSRLASVRELLPGIGTGRGRFARPAVGGWLVHRHGDRGGDRHLRHVRRS